MGQALVAGNHLEVVIKDPGKPSSMASPLPSLIEHNPPSQSSPQIPLTAEAACNSRPVLTRDGDERPGGVRTWGFRPHRSHLEPTPVGALGSVGSGGQCCWQVENRHTQEVPGWPCFCPAGGSLSAPNPSRKTGTLSPTRERRECGGMENHSSQLWL